LAERLLDTDEKTSAVDRPIEDEGGIDPVAAKGD
jgi:hypothetical protein